MYAVHLFFIESMIVAKDCCGMLPYSFGSALVRPLKDGRRPYIRLPRYCQKYSMGAISVDIAVHDKTSIPFCKKNSV